MHNQSSKGPDLLLHLELLANADCQELATQAVLMTAQLFLAEGRLTQMHSVLSRAIETSFESKRLTLYLQLADAVLLLTKKKNKKGI